MSTRTAVIEKVSDFSKVAGHAPATAVDDVQPGVYAGLIARLFGGEKTNTVVAFTSSRSGSVVGRTIRRLALEVERTTGMRCSVVTASELIAASAVRGRLRVSAGPSGGAGCTDRLTTDLAAEADVVLVDGGSLIPGGEVLAVARKVDAIVVVVESGRTRKKDLSHAISTISAAGGRIAGLVLHRQKRPLPDWLERLIG